MILSPMPGALRRSSPARLAAALTAVFLVLAAVPAGAASGPVDFDHLGISDACTASRDRMRESVDQFRSLIAAQADCRARAAGPNTCTGETRRLETARDRYETNKKNWIRDCP